MAAIDPTNLMETLVEQKVDKLMLEAGMCCCTRCRADVVTLSLNTLPAAYTSSLGGDIYARFHANSAQTQADVTATILSAIAVVKKRPRHPGREQLEI